MFLNQEIKQMNKFLFLTFNRYEGQYSSKVIIESTEELSIDLMKKVMMKEFELNEEELKDSLKWNKIEKTSDIVCQDCEEESYLLTQI